MTNSHTFQSASGLNTITRPTPKRSGGNYPPEQQVVITNLVSFWWKTDLLRFRSMIWSSQTFPFPRSSKPWEWQLPLGVSPLQPWRVGEAQGTGANQSSPTILMENHQDGGDWSRGRREGNGRLYQVHETLLSYRDEALEDVEGGWKSSELISAFSRELVS